MGSNIGNAGIYLCIAKQKQHYFWLTFRLRVICNKTSRIGYSYSISQDVHLIFVIKLCLCIYFCIVLLSLGIIRFLGSLYVYTQIYSCISNVCLFLQVHEKINSPLLCVLFCRGSHEIAVDKSKLIVSLSDPRNFRSSSISMKHQSNVGIKE